MNEVINEADRKAAALKQLDEARAAISELDGALTDLLIRRTACYDQVADAKTVLGKPIKDEDVEKKKLTDLSSRTMDEQTAAGLVEVYRTIMRQSRIWQYRHLAETGDIEFPAIMPRRFKKVLPTYKIAVTQGTDNSHGAKAAGYLFPEATLLHTKTFLNAARQVTDATAPVVVLPLENTTAGSVDEVYKLLENEQLYIVASLDMPICHRLCVLPGTKMSAIRHIISHPQALAQCSVFAQTMGWTSEAIQNTAFAAAKVKVDGKRSQAALASEEAAKAYGLEVLPAQIANEETNTTRFIALTGEPVITEGADTLTLICRLPHSKGSLANLLALLETYNLNLKKILSRPVPGKPWEYSFYLDIETEPVSYEKNPEQASGLKLKNRGGHRAILSALEALSQELEVVRFIGWYRQEKWF